MMMDTPVYRSDKSVGNTYSLAWKFVQENWKLLLGLAAISFVVSIPANIASEDSPAILHLFESIYSFLVVTPVTVGTSWVILKRVRGEATEVMDVREVFSRNYINLLISSILVGVIVGIGFVLFIIPGIYLAIRLSYFGLFIIDEQLGAWEAIQASWDVTSGHTGTMFMMALVALFLFFLGILALVVGVIVSAMVVSAAYTIFFYSISAQGRKRKPKNDDRYAFDELDDFV